MTARTERAEQAERAVKNFRAMLPGFNSYARALTGRQTLRIEISKTEGAATDGGKIYIRPPIALGNPTPHDRRLCDKRDPDTLAQQCEACRTREEVLSLIYHEVAHIAFQSFTPVSEQDRAEITRRAAEELGSKYGKVIVERIEAMPDRLKFSYPKLAGMINEFLPMILNSLEDARVNSAMFRARAGTQRIFEAQAIKIFDEGVVQSDGSVKMWRDYPLNLQAIIGLYVKASGYEYDGWLCPKVLADLEDEVLTEICSRVTATRSPGDVYNLSFRALARLRELGYCKSLRDPDEPDEEEPDGGDEESDGEPEPADEEAGEGADDGPADEGGDEAAPGGEPDGDPEAAEDGEPVDDDGPKSEEEVDEDANRDADQDGSGGGETDSDGDEDSDLESDGPAGDSGDVLGDDPDSAPDDEQDADDDSSDGEWDHPNDTGEDDSEAAETPDSEPGDGGSDDDDEPGDGGSDDDDEPGDGGSADGTGDGDSDISEGADSSDDTHASADSDSTDESEELSDDGSGEGAGDSEQTDPEGGESSHTDDRRPDEGGQPVDNDQPGKEAEPEADGTADGPGKDGDDSDQSDDLGGEDDGDPLAARSGHGIESPDLDYGEAFEIAEAIARAIRHDPDTGDVLAPEEAAESAMEAREIDRVITQGDWFETPSSVIGGVRIHKHGDYSTKPSIHCSNGWSGHGDIGYSPMEMGQAGDFTPSEVVLAPALLRMRVAFSENQRGRTTAQLKSGKINARALGKRAWGDDERLFKKKDRPGKRSYFVLLGMDISGSTIGENIVLAKEAIWAQAELCHRMGIPFAMYAHSGNRVQGEMIFVDVYSIKAPNEPWNDKSKEALRTIGPDAANLDGHTLEFYRKVLDGVTATDKIIMYYTDGKMPAENYAEELEILQREIRTCKQKGYTLMAVGIRTDSPTEHGLSTAQVSEHADIVGVVRHLEKRLERGVR